MTSPLTHLAGLIAVALFLALGSSQTASAQDRERPATAQELNEAYRTARDASLAGDHQKVLNLLLPYRQRGPASPTIDYALGTAAARLQRSGEALAYLESSLIMAPRDRDARANWNLIQQSLPSPAKTFTAFPQRWHSFLSPVEWFFAAGFAYIAGWAMLAVGILNRGPDRQPGMLRGAVALLAISVVLTGLFLVSRSHAMLGAYISSPQPAAVRSGPGSGFKSILELPSGSRVQLETLRQDAGHYVILLPDGGTGFIPAPHLTPVGRP